MRRPPWAPLWRVGILRRWSNQASCISGRSSRTDERLGRYRGFGSEIDFRDLGLGHYRGAYQVRALEGAIRRHFRIRWRPTCRRPRKSGFANIVATDLWIGLSAMLTALRAAVEQMYTDLRSACDLKAPKRSLFETRA